MRLLSALLGKPVDHERENEIAHTERQIVEARGRLRDSVQNIESGSRVLENMAGMMTLLRDGR